MVFFAASPEAEVNVVASGSAQQVSRGCSGVLCYYDVRVFLDDQLIEVLEDNALPPVRLSASFPFWSRTLISSTLYLSGVLSIRGFQGGGWMSLLSSSFSIHWSLPFVSSKSHRELGCIPLYMRCHWMGIKPMLKVSSTSLSLSAYFVTSSRSYAVSILTSTYWASMSLCIDVYRVIGVADST